MDAGSGPIAFAGTLSSPNTKNLTLTTTGTLGFGVVTGLGDISITGASSGLTATSISGNSLVGSVALNGPVNITGAQTYQDRISLATSGTSSMNVGSISTTNRDITLATNLGTLTVGALTAQNGTNGNINLTHGGTLTFGGNILAGRSLNVTTNNGASIVVGNGSNVSMQALGGGVSLTGAVTLVNDLSINADRKSTRLNSSHIPLSRMPSSA